MDEERGGGEGRKGRGREMSGGKRSREQTRFMNRSGDKGGKGGGKGVKGE